MNKTKCGQVFKLEPSKDNHMSHNKLPNSVCHWVLSKHSVLSPCKECSLSNTRRTRVDSRDLQTSPLSIWRYHCLGEGGISEDLKSILITIWYSASEVFVHPLCPSSNFVYRSLESTLVSLLCDSNASSR